MIRFSLKCDQGHRFESWFQSSHAYDKLHAAGMISCTECGSTHVEKALMAPALGHDNAKPRDGEASAKGNDAPTGDAAGASAPSPLAPTTEREKALAALRREVEKNSDYVGINFAAEARAMHMGEAPERAIHGEARLDEARQLIEEGVPVAPLPFTTSRKTN